MAGGWIVAASAAGPAGTASPGQVVEEGLRRQQERVDAQQQPAAVPDALTSVSGTSQALQLPVESPCFVIERIELEGEGTRRLSWLHGGLDAALGQCVGVQGLRSLAAWVDGQLLQQGHATSRASLPAQNLAEGTLHLHIDVGRIGNIRMVDAQGQPDTAWGTWVNSFPVRPGDVLDVHAIEQGVEQMKRVPTQTVTTRIEPGETPQTSDLVIERQAASGWQRLRGGLTLDNSGTPPLGRGELALNLAFDNPLGLSDLLSAQFSSNLENPSAEHRSQSSGVDYSVPLGSSTFAWSRSHSRFAQEVALTTTTVLSSGWSDSTRLHWDDVAWRTASWKFGVEADVERRQARGFLDDAENLVQRRQTTFFEPGVSLRLLTPDGGTLDASYARRRGVPWFGAEPDYAGEPGGLTLRPHIHVMTASFSDDVQAGSHLVQWQSELRAQRTSAGTTLSIDQLAIGGRTSVRGYDGDRVLIAESGWVWRNEASTGMGTVAGAALAGYVACDAGRVWGPSGAQLAGHALAGTALGLRGQRGHLQFDLALAAPLGHPEAFQAAPVVTYASITVAL